MWSEVASAAGFQRLPAARAAPVHELRFGRLGTVWAPRYAAACRPARTETEGSDGVHLDSRVSGNWILLSDERDRRLGMNEALYREVNERVSEVVEQFVEVETDSRVNFTCECGNPACAEQIAMTLTEYEGIRAEPTRFAVKIGHELPEIERVVDRRPTYLVVEKEDPEAEEVAVETDPRS